MSDDCLKDHQNDNCSLGQRCQRKKSADVMQFANRCVIKVFHHLFMDGLLDSFTFCHKNSDVLENEDEQQTLPSLAISTKWINLLWLFPMVIHCNSILLSA